MLLEVYNRLLARYGPQNWWPGESAFEVMVGAILTQAATWRQVERTIGQLKAEGLFSLEGLRDISEERLALLLRPCGYFNAKARKLKALINHIWERYGGDLGRLLAQPLPDLRDELLSIYGVGEETADDIVLYAAGKPSFVVDAYTRRILKRLGLAPERESYRAYQELFHGSLPRDARLFNEYHALLVRHGKTTCRAEPLCGGCCLLEMCPTGRGREA